MIRTTSCVLLLLVVFSLVLFLHNRVHYTHHNKNNGVKCPTRFRVKRKHHYYLCTAVAAAVGASVGPSVGSSVGCGVGSSVGSLVGTLVDGPGVGSLVGASVGSFVGPPVGSPVKNDVGSRLTGASETGNRVGPLVGV
jgi:hypothetical protein